MGEWDGDTARWWVDEVGTDPAYATDVDPLLLSLIPPVIGPVADLGCGEGRLAGRAPVTVGFDSSPDLARAASRRFPVAVADVVRLPVADACFSGALAVLVLEHMEHVGPFFAEAHRVVQEGGFLVVVINHPTFTAPGSGPFVDLQDGEVLWRWGTYFAAGYTDEPAGVGSVRFHHRSMGGLLNEAAAAGWSLEEVRERAVSPDGDPLLAAQDQIPRLLGVRWRR